MRPLGLADHAGERARMPVGSPAPASAPRPAPPAGPAHGRAAAPRWSADRREIAVAHRRRRAVLLLVLLAAVAPLAGCGSGSRQMLRSGLPVLGRARVAVLPLEDLSGEPAAAVSFTRMLFAELVQAGTCDVPESGIVEEVLDSLGIRNGGSLRADQVRALGARLGVGHLLTGTLLESGMVRTGDGEVPAVGAALKLIEVATARAVWARMKFRTGEDRETVFGWGRERSPQILMGSLAREMIADFVVLTADSSAVKTGASK